MCLNKVLGHDGPQNFSLNRINMWIQENLKENIVRRMIQSVNKKTREYPDGVEIEDEVTVCIVASDAAYRVVGGG